MSGLEQGFQQGAAMPTKLFIGGITRHTNTKQLREHFSKYGRVLDCVAMREADGRSRGFGYVTLDSPTAAEKCLEETQVIDGRAVDLKPAVPEGNDSATPTPKASDVMARAPMGSFHGSGGILAARRRDHTVVDTEGAGGSDSGNAAPSPLEDVMHREGVDEAWNALEDMQKQGHFIDRFTVSHMLTKTAGYRGLALVERFIASRPDEADEVLFNAMLDACCRLKDLTRLESTVQCMKDMKIEASHVTLGILVKAYGQAGDATRVMKVWEEMVDQRRQENAVTYGCMIDALVKCGHVHKAVEIFQDMKRKKKHRNTILYTTLIKGFGMEKDLCNALTLFKEMKAEGVPYNTITYNVIIDVCIKCNDVQAAETLVREMMVLGSNLEPDLITFSTILKGYCHIGDLFKALQVAETIKACGLKCDELVYNTLLDGCVKATDLSAGAANFALYAGIGLFAEMTQGHMRPSLITHSILVRLYQRNGFADKADATEAVAQLYEHHGLERPNLNAKGAGKGATGRRRGDKLQGQASGASALSGPRIRGRPPLPLPPNAAGLPGFPPYMPLEALPAAIAAQAPPLLPVPPLGVGAPFTQAAGQESLAGAGAPMPPSPHGAWPGTPGGFGQPGAISCLDVLNLQLSYQAQAPGPVPLSPPPPAVAPVGLLSADAPEFVPMGAPQAAAAPEAAPVPAVAAPPAPLEAPATAPARATLGEITNIVGQQGSSKRLGEPAKPKSTGSKKSVGVYTDPEAAMPPPGLDPEPWTAAAEAPKGPTRSTLGEITNIVGNHAALDSSKTGGAKKQDASAFGALPATTLGARKPPGLEMERVINTSAEDAANYSSDEESDAGSSLAGAAAAAQQMLEAGELPSMGSAQHGTGECRRCNFFPKGRCQNGQNCNFCHFPHEKRKPSRQDRREWRAARLAQQEKAAQSEGAPQQPEAAEKLAMMQMQDMDMGGENAMQTLAYLQLPSPLPLPGALPLLPPGLPAPPIGLAGCSGQTWQGSVAHGAALPPPR